MTFQFEYNREKAKTNFRKHGVSFQEAKTIFSDPFSITIDDELHSQEELRFITIGYSEEQRLLVVVYIYREERIRIISARPAVKSERRIYEQRI